ncbi:unnamed protein product [Amoebophrya sp. A25]|nr:unnamed protein product [Amoebophrya sp. A25]|eukprot:GSA25T00006837001.1
MVLIPQDCVENWSRRRLVPNCPDETHAGLSTAFVIKSGLSKGARAFQYASRGAFTDRQLGREETDASSSSAYASGLDADQTQYLQNKLVRGSRKGLRKKIRGEFGTIDGIAHKKLFPRAPARQGTGDVLSYGTNWVKINQNADQKPNYKLGGEVPPWVHVRLAKARAAKNNSSGASSASSSCSGSSSALLGGQPYWESKDAGRRRQRERVKNLHSDPERYGLVPTDPERASAFQPPPRKHGGPAFASHFQSSSMKLAGTDENAEFNASRAHAKFAARDKHPLNSRRIYDSLREVSSLEPQEKLRVMRAIRDEELWASSELQPRRQKEHRRQREAGNGPPTTRPPRRQSLQGTGWIRDSPKRRSSIQQPSFCAGENIDARMEAIENQPTVPRRLHRKSDFYHGVG